MKKYFKDNQVEAYYVTYPSGVLSIHTWTITWYEALRAEDLEILPRSTECAREECEAAYKQTIQFLNDKINGN